MVFAIEKIRKQAQDVRSAIHREVHPILEWRFCEGQCPDAHQPDFDDRDWANFALGGAWGGYDVTAWFRATVPIPRHLRSKKLALRFLLGPRDGGNSTAEALLYVNGVPLQAIDVWHEEAWLPPEHLLDDQIHIAIKAWSGVLDIPPHRHFKVAQLVAIDEPAERLFYQVDTLLGAAEQLDEHDLRRVDLLRAVDGAVRQIEFTTHDLEHFYRTIAAATSCLSEHIVRLQQQEQIAPKVVGVGHSHIDLAWLWRLSHAREKAARTFSTVLHLMRQYPEYSFLHSSPQAYKFLQQDYPDIFDHVEEMIGAGRWEVAGGMWVEPDCNIPSGESLVRQILLGKRYFRQQFGVDTHLLWLPDVFGYPWSLPQLLRRSGMPYFMTTKLSWNQFNQMPYDTFRWRGIDGSEVLTHFVTTPEAGDGSWHHTYNGQLTPFDVKGVWQNYQQKDLNDELMVIYGWGDGGGGPTQGMLESANVLRHVPGLPRVELGKAEPFFERLAERLEGADVPVWDGELYLEFHRGTYTSQAQNKRRNRKAEVLYHDAEWMSALVDVVLQRRAYPLHALHDGWELLLLNQFHDILPGSSIRQVYEDSQEQYDEIERVGQAALDQAQQALIGEIAADQNSLVVFNDVSWTRNGLIEHPYDEAVVGKTIMQPNGRTSPVQVVEHAGERTVLFAVDDVPSLGYRTYPLVEQSAAVAEPLIVRPNRLENEYYRITLNSSGQITRLWDKRHERDVLSAGAVGNQFQAFQDKPMAFDAWDIDIYYRDKLQPVDDLTDVVVEETGPLRAVLRLQWHFRSSTITQRMMIYANSPRIDFRTEVDWHEQQTLLKVAFPIAVRTTKATYDIQWGNIERPTHWNTSWDWARFETVGHKWVDLSEGNYGMALLNDCKYGHDVKDNIMRLTLIKSPVRPDPQADQGYHQFTYSLLPHAGGWRDGDVVPQAYDLNYPLRATSIAAQPAGRAPTYFAFATTPSEHIIVETVKRAEDDDAWIVRAYEYKQQRGDVTIRFGMPVARVAECNLLEEVIDEVPVQHQQISFAVAPYEVRTWKVWFG